MGADYFPFAVVTLTRVRDDTGEPTDVVEIEGLRQGGMRTGSKLQPLLSYSVGPWRSSEDLELGEVFVGEELHPDLGHGVAILGQRFQQQSVRCCYIGRRDEFG